MGIMTQYWSHDIALALFSIILTAYLYLTRNFNYWLKKGVTEIRPLPLFGNFIDCCLFRKTSGEYFASMYNLGKGLPYLGLHVFDKPAILLRDPDIMKSVLVKNFDHFVDRYANTHKSDTIGSANMFLLNNPQWKIARRATTNFFTTAKIKGMFQLLLDIGNNLATRLDVLQLQGEGCVIEVKEICANFTTDVISSCAFGWEVDCLNDPKSAIRQSGVDIFGFVTYKRGAEVAAFFFYPFLAKLLRLKFFTANASNFLRNILWKTINLRMATNTKRNDFIDLLVELKNNQSQTDDPNGYKFDGDNLIGQAVNFFAAGFETTSTAIAFSLHELALQPKLQSRLREEIISALDETGGEITYEMVTNLSYMDMVISETLRKYPPLPFLDRKSIRDFKLPGTDLVIEKGTPVYISLLGLHHDPEYYPDPQKFDPERFSKEKKKMLPSCTYMPFGDGPRNCIGFRFGLLVVKLGVLKFILNHEITASPQTQNPIKLDPKATLLASKGGVFLKIRKIRTYRG